MKKITYKAFTLAELLASLAIMMVVALLVMNVLNNTNSKQRELIARLDNSYQKLNSMIGVAVSTSVSENDRNWATSKVGTIKGLTCTDAAGTDVANKSECLKEVLTSVSGNAVSCEGNVGDCFKSFATTNARLEEIFSNVGYSADDMTAIKLPGDVRVGLSYIDGECNTNIPIGTDRTGTMHYRKGCGFMLVDVNGNQPPNAFANNGGNSLVDRFILVLSKNDVLKSNPVIDAVAGCADGTVYNSTTKRCEEPIPCPADEERNAAITAANDADVLSENYPLGMDRTDCVTYVCRDGSAFDSDLKCPEACPAAGQFKRGGLWKSEGGDLDNLWSTKECCIPIEDQQGLANMANDLDASYCLMDDIEFNKNGAGTDGDKGWIPIGTYSNPFEGNFYGNGHKISGLYINRDDLADIGLFGAISGTVQDLELANADIKSSCSDGSCHFSIFSGFANDAAIIKRVNTGGRLEHSGASGKSYIGGISGRINTTDANAEIIDSYNTADINFNPATQVGGWLFMGGVVADAQNSLSINSIINRGDIVIAASGLSAEQNEIGGVVGQNFANDLSSIMNLGDITINGNSNVGRIDMGGVVGFTQQLNNAINLGSINNGGVSGFVNLGGISGFIYDGDDYSFLANYGEVDSSTTAGSISVGGIVGTSQTDTIANAINASTRAWLVGSSSVPITLYRVIQIFNNSIPFSLTDLTLEQSYLVTSTLSVSGSNTISGGLVYGGTQDQLKQASTFSALSADTTNWNIQDGFYPSFQAAIMPPQPFKDCRNTPPEEVGQCYDVLNTRNAWNFDYIWAWKIPAAGGIVEPPVLRYQCSDYKAVGGFNCCKPSYTATSAPDNTLPVCPAL